MEVSSAPAAAGTKKKGDFLPNLFLFPLARRRLESGEELSKIKDELKVVLEDLGLLNAILKKAQEGL